MFQIRIYDRMKVILISNCVLYFETPGISKYINVQGVTREYIKGKIKDSAYCSLIQN